MAARRLAIRWTIGDVNPLGFEALKLSVTGMWKLFGPGALYRISVNSLPLEQAQAWTGELPCDIEWHVSTREQIPAFLQQHLDSGMSEGVGWKFAPLRLFPEHCELALDNDCILWELPAALAAWLNSDDAESCLIAEDVRPCFGQFTGLCGAAPRNSGIRGLPPGFDMAAALQEILRMNPVMLRSELDEQGLQVAAVSCRQIPHVVTVQEVSICSPFPPHRPYFGNCGAHFVGLNAKQLPWNCYERPAVELIREHWLRLKPTLEQRIAGVEAIPF